MSPLKRFLRVPTWLRMRLSGTSLASWYSHLNTWVYRVSKGKLWAHLYVPETKALMPILLLETRGRRTGRRRVTPLIYCEYDGRLLLAAANAGHDNHPGWFLNLQGSADVGVSIGGERLPAVASITSLTERDAALAAFAKCYPPLVRYAAATSRKIPMVLLRRRENGDHGYPW